MIEMIRRGIGPGLRRIQVQARDGRQSTTVGGQQLLLEA